VSPDALDEDEIERPCAAGQEPFQSRQAVVQPLDRKVDVQVPRSFTEFGRGFDRDHPVPPPREGRSVVAGTRPHIKDARRAIGKEMKDVAMHLLEAESGRQEH
jgi:hypothetical protein